MKKSRKWVMVLAALVIVLGNAVSSFAAVKDATLPGGAYAYNYATSTYAYAYTQHTTAYCYCRLTVYGADGSTILEQKTIEQTGLAPRDYTCTGSNTISKSVSAHKATYTDGTSSGFKTLTVTP